MNSEISKFRDPCIFLCNDILKALNLSGKTLFVLYCIAMWQTLNQKVSKGHNYVSGHYYVRLYFVCTISILNSKNFCFALLDYDLQNNECFISMQMYQENSLSAAGG